LPYALERRFLQSFDEQRDRSLPDLLINVERTLTDLGEVNSDHAIVVVQKT
jgi:hypothetical protein